MLRMARVQLTVPLSPTKMESVIILAYVLGTYRAHERQSEEKDLGKIEQSLPSCQLPPAPYDTTSTNPNSCPLILGTVGSLARVGVDRTILLLNQDVRCFRRPHLVRIHAGRTLVKHSSSEGQV
jgi:hypothetical protein